MTNIPAYYYLKRTDYHWKETHMQRAKRNKRWTIYYRYSIHQQGNTLHGDLSLFPWKNLFALWIKMLGIRKTARVTRRLLVFSLL